MDIFLFYIILVLFLAVTVFLGYLGFRGTKELHDFTLAGRSVHPYMMAISYGASFISTSAIVGFGGVAGVYGLGILWLPFLNIFLGIIIAFLVFGKKTREMGEKLNAQTFPEFLGKRYQSPLIQRISGMVIFFFMPLYAGVVLIGAARFIEATLNIDFPVALFVFSAIIAAYVITGGLKGVLYNDTFQGTIMLLGMMILLFITYRNLGGIQSAHQALADLAWRVPQTLAEGGHQGWTQMPQMGTPVWWTLVSTIILGVGIGVLAQPQLLVRFMTVKNNRALNRGVLVGGIFVFFTTVVPYVCGALSNVYFMQTSQDISFNIAGGNSDLIIPLYINMAMPDWFVYIFMLTLLSASMSTISTQFHTMGTAFSRDLFARGFAQRKNERRDLHVSKLGIGMGIAISVILGFYLPPNIIARGTALFFGVCAAAFLPPYVAALYWKRADRTAAIASMVTGTAASLFWMLFIHLATSAQIGLANFLWGMDSLLGYPFTHIDPILIALPISGAVMAAVSLLKPPPASG